MDTVSQIKQKLDIVDVIGSYLTVKKAGRNYKTTCPFHSEDTPSFMVSPELQIFKCFGCGEGGDMFSFVQKIEGVDFARSLEILADKAGIKIERQDIDPNHKKKTKIFEINEVTSDFYHHLLTKHPAGKKGLDYLTKERKLKLETIKEFRLGYAPTKWDTLHQFLAKKGYSDEEMQITGSVLARDRGKGFIDKFRGRIIFPLVDVGGKIVGFTGRDLIGHDPKYLNTPETLVYNKSSYLYGLDKAKVEIKKGGAVFVEGQVDVIKAHQHGIKNVIASSGTALTSAQLRIISRFTRDLTLCFDPDSAGMAATARALDLTNQYDFEVKVCLIPPEFSDLDEFITASARNAKSALENAIPVYDFYLVHALKEFDEKTAYGKKKIVDYLAPIYSRITNKVVQDHYIKELSEKVEISEDAIRASLKSPPKEARQRPEVIGPAKKLPPGEEKVKKSPEEYLLSLLLKTGLDTMGSYVYKLEPHYFVSDRNREIFTRLKGYIDSKPKEFKIKYFTDELGDDLKEIILEMYLWDFGEITSNQDLLLKDIEATISRLKKETVKRRLKELTEQIKLAEMEKNSKKVKELSQEFKRLSETLL